MAIWKFRFLALLLFIFVGAIAMANLVAEFLRPNPLPHPSRSSTAPLPEQISATNLASKIVPFRSDLKADYAQALAGAALHIRARDGAEEQKDAQNAIRGALAIGPRDSPLWLVLGVLQARRSPADPLIAESLKMSYLTGLNQSQLIPLRLGVVTSNNSLTDSDLGDLARADVRALLTQLPDGRKELLGDYQRASEVGKRFLEETIAAIDPEFVATLRDKK